MRPGFGNTRLPWLFGGVVGMMLILFASIHLLCAVMPHACKSREDWALDRSCFTVTVLRREYSEVVMGASTVESYRSDYRDAWGSPNRGC